MSFLAGLLRREITPGPTSSGTTTASAVVPRLASRFENPGAPRWPGDGQQDGAGPFTSDPETRQDPEPGPDAGPPGIRGATDQDLAAEAQHPGRTTSTAAPRPSGTPPARKDIHRAASTAPKPSDLLLDVHPDGPGMGERPAASAAGAAAWQRAPTISSPAPRLDPVGGNAQSGILRPAGTGEANHRAPQTSVVHGTPRQGAENGPAARGVPEGLDALPGTRERPVRPHLEPLPRREPTRAPEQHIHVSIGRIEVRAVAVAAPQRPEPERIGLMSLDDYLKDLP